MNPAPGELDAAAGRDAQQAADGGYFTQVLLSQLRQPRAGRTSLYSLFLVAGKAVFDKTNGQQSPALIQSASYPDIEIRAHKLVPICGTRPASFAMPR